MKTQLILAGVLLMVAASTACAVPYTETYQIFQDGYNDGGTVTGEIRITDLDEDGVFSANDTLSGLFIFRRPLQFSTYVRGFDVVGVSGQLPLSGLFTISALSHLGSTILMTGSGGTVIDYAFPVTGQFTTYTTTQAPVMTRSIPDGGSALLMLGMGLITLRRLVCLR